MCRRNLSLETQRSFCCWSELVLSKVGVFKLACDWTRAQKLSSSQTFGLKKEVKLKLRFRKKVWTASVKWYPLFVFWEIPFLITCTLWGFSRKHRHIKTSWFLILPADNQIDLCLACTCSPPSLSVSKEMCPCCPSCSPIRQFRPGYFRRRMRHSAISVSEKQVSARNKKKRRRRKRKKIYWNFPGSWRA